MHKIGQFVNFLPCDKMADFNFSVRYKKKFASHMVSTSIDVRIVLIAIWRGTGLGRWRGGWGSAQLAAR